MTKQDLQKELLEKVKPGVKASDIKKLKRSKSTGDIPNTIPNPPPPNLLQDQLKEKQSQVESLTKESETKSTTIRLLREKLDRDTKEQEITELKEQLKETKQQLDDSLTARVAGVKVFGQEHSQRIKSEQELNETIDQASNELEKGDSEISQLRTQLNQLKSSKEQLERELKLARLNRNSPSIANSVYNDNFDPNLNYLQYALYSLTAVLFTLWLTNHLKKLENHGN